MKINTINHDSINRMVDSLNHLLEEEGKHNIHISENVLIVFRRAILGICEVLVDKHEAGEPVNFDNLIRAIITQVEWVDENMGWNRNDK